VWLGIVTLFPEMFTALEYGITGRALKSGLIDVTYWNPRDFTDNKYRNVDDRPYGGGPGMVMMVQPALAAIEAAKKAAPAGSQPKVIYLSPQGRPFTQAIARETGKQQSLILLAGRYEGIDERLLALAVHEEWSMGDYVLSGGEIAALAVVDAVTRLLPGALGDEGSAEQDSFSKDLLEYPQYTRPDHFQGLTVPDVLIKGNHKDIARWRLKQSLGRTWLKRPDLLAKKELTPLEQILLNEFIEEKQS